MKMDARKWAVLAAAVVLAVGIFAAVRFSVPRGSSVYESIQIMATKTGEHGVETDSTFAITLDRSVDEAALRGMLRPEPDIAYTLAGGGKRWTLVPEEPLLENAVYTFCVVDETGAVMRSFAFQTKSGLLVSSVYPRPGATWVELESGIEFTFNTSGVEAAEYFSIEPNIAGEFKSAENTTIFVPEEPLLQDSIYRVTLKAGLAAPNGMVLAEDYTFAFETQESDGKGRYEDLVLYGSFDETFLPSDPVVLKLRGGDMTGAKMTLAIHRYPGVREYAAELQKRAAYYAGRTGLKREYEVQTQELEPVGDLRSELTPGDRWWSTSWMALEQGLPEGWYVLTLRGESPSGRPQLVQKLVQVCNVAAFAQAADGDALVWLNDAATGTPMEGARVQLQEESGAEQRAGVTDATGLLGLRTDKMERAWLSVEDGGQTVYFGTVELTAAQEKPLWESFYAAAYKDREIYQPTDKIQFWGVLRPREGGKLPGSAVMELTTGSSTALYKTRVVPGADGTFLGELSFTGLEAGWYGLQLTDGSGGVYWSGSAWVEQFTKPPVILTAKPEKNWYYIDEAVNFTLSATYYDGTPAAGAKLRLTSPYFAGQGETRAQKAEMDSMAGSKVILPGIEEMDDEAQQGVLVTLDGQGKGVCTVQLENKEEWKSWSPAWVNYQVQSADAQEVYLTANGHLRALTSRYACAVTLPEQDRLVVKTARLNEDAVAQEAAGELSYRGGQSEFERLAGAPAELPITVEFIKTVRRRVPNGEYYDEINQKTVTRYRYESEDSVLRTEEVRTAGGSAEFAVDPAWVNDDDTDYWVRVRFDGGMGYEMEEHYYFRTGGGMEENIRRYAFAADDANEEFALGASVPLALYENNVPVHNAGSVLYSAVQGGIRSTAVFTGAGVSVEFTEDCIPNIALAGAYFDGKHIFTVQPYNVRYDYKERTLAVEVRADAPSYAPGGEAKLTVTLRDAQGKPVSGSACVGVVDESIFALAPQQVELASQLYSNLRSTYVVQKSSYKEYDLRANPDTAGGMGGGGDGAGNELRGDFVDTALFQTVAVGESGTAEVVLTLPDNITQWRVTAAAVTADGKAGDGVGEAVATLPFYVRAIVTDAYLAGDDVSIGALAVGTALTGGERVEYTATLLDGSKNVLAQQKTQATGQAYWNLGKQPEGQYTVRVEAKSGEYADGVELPFSVVKTGATVRVVKRVELAELSAVQPVRWPAVVELYDVRLEPYMNSLRVLSGRAGARTEVLAAAYRAQVAQNELLPEDERHEIQKDVRLTAIQDYESGVRPLPNAEPDAALTAKMLLAAPQLVNGDFARVYLQGVLRDPAAPQDSRLMAYVGLAALHEPVLLDITARLESGELSTAQRLYLGAGLAALGDYGGANAVYDAIAAQQRKAAGEGGQPDTHFLDGADENERLQNTGAALLLCAITGHADADGLANWLCAALQEKPREDANVLVDLELLAYTRYFRLGAAELAAFSYVSEDGKRVTVGLGQTGVQTLSLSAEAFAEADVKAVTGKLAAGIRYSAAAELPQTAPNGPVTVEKTVTPLGGSLKAPGLARVDIRLKFAPDAPEGVYSVFDSIPSGMRFVPYVGGETMMRTGESGTRMDNEGQQMSGTVWYSLEGDGPMPLLVNAEMPEAEAQVNPSTAEEPGMEAPDAQEPQSNERVLTYYVSCPLPGSYVLESAYSMDTLGELAALTPRGTVKID